MVLRFYMSIWKKAPAEKALKHSSGARWARPALLPPQAFDDPLPAVRGGGCTTCRS